MGDLMQGCPNCGALSPVLVVHQSAPGERGRGDEKVLRDRFLAQVDEGSIVHRPAEGNDPNDWECRVCHTAWPAD